MSQKNITLKKVRREFRKSKGKIILQIADELLREPLKSRIKLAWKIIRGKRK